MTERYVGADRRSNLSLTKDDLQLIINTVMEKHLVSEHHLFVASWMKKEQRNQELWEKTKSYVVGWASVGVLMFLAQAFWNEFMSVLPFFRKPQ